MYNIPTHIKKDTIVHYALFLSFSIFYSIPIILHIKYISIIMCTDKRNFSRKNLTSIIGCMFCSIKKVVIMMMTMMKAKKN